MFYKVVAVGFNTLCYDAERCRKTAGIKPSARMKGGVQAFAAVCIALLYGWVFIALGIAAMLIILRLRKRHRKAG
ncbi:hypothetical protein C5N99_08190 [Treponema medium]|nr:hypothetical protein C5N99_08190 [Treponema medium]